MTHQRSHNRCGYIRLTPAGFGWRNIGSLASLEGETCHSGAKILDLNPSLTAPACLATSCELTSARGRNSRLRNLGIESSAFGVIFCCFGSCIECGGRKIPKWGPSSSDDFGQRVWENQNSSLATGCKDPGKKRLKTLLCFVKA